MPKLDHIALQVKDLDRAIDFYTGRLGFRLLSRAVNAAQQEGYCFLEAEDGTRLELIQDLAAAFTPPPPHPPYCPHVCFKSEDLGATMEMMEKAGIKVLRGPFVIENEETWVYFTDPDGNVLEFIQWFKING